MAKVGQHNEWFRPVVKPVCPCGKSVKKHGIDGVWAWGEYHNAKWRPIGYFCRDCWQTSVAAPLKAHTNDCGCTVNLCSKSGCGPLPDWMTLECSI